MPSALNQFGGGSPADGTVTPAKIVSTFGGFFRNKIANGDFVVATGGTSYANPANGSTTLDAWVVSYDGTLGALTVSQQSHTIGQTVVPDNPEFFYRWNQTSAGSGASYRRIEQRITGVRTLSGKVCSISFYAKADSARNVDLSLVQNFGSGGSADVSTSGGTLALTTSWQLFTVQLNIPSVSGKTIGSGNYLAMRLGLPINVTMTIDVSHVQIEENGITPFEQRPYYLEALLCLGLAGTTFDALAPTTTQGDTIFRNATTNARLGIGTAGQTYKTNGAATAPEWVTQLPGDYICIQNQQTAGTDAGTWTAGADRTIPLNTEVADTGNHASIAANQITLLAGTYRVFISCPAYAVARFQVWLQNITDGTRPLIGTTESAYTTSPVTSRSIIAGRLTIAGTKVFEVQGRCEVTRASDGMGIAASFNTEVYGTVILIRE